jgi:hypothetical protein
MPVATTAPARRVQYDWPRFWIEHTGILDLSDAGFLRDPVDHGYTGDPLKPLASLDQIPAVALLGEPGIGKSTALRIEHERLRALPATAKAVSIYVDLKVTASEERLYRQLFESAEIEAWKTGETHLYLLLDSLDEAMLRIETIAHLLVEGLKDLPADRLSVRITCRTAVWPAATLGRALQDMWGDSGLGVYELAPLRRCDVVAALTDNAIDPDEFIPKLFGAHAVPFAIKPLTLKMLIKLYQRDGRLPTSTTDLYRQGCLALCEEQNDSRRETRRHGHLNAKQRLRVAGRIAAATVLGGRFAVWTGPETDVPGEDVSISALTGAREEGDFAQFTPADDDVREVLDTGLFSARGDVRMGWAHQTYGEFLASLYLYEKGVPPDTILKALTHPSGGLIPPLAVMGAWAASLSQEVRATLIASDPWTLLRGDLSNWTPADLAALVSSMLAYIEAGGFYDFFFGIGETYGRLKHPNLAAQLRATITDGSLRAITRRMALSITERCELGDLQPELLAMAFDQTEDPMLRAAATAALRRCGDASVPSQILALLQTGIGADPHTEIRGYALDLLWPNHITATQLFSFLEPSDEHYVGSYAHFVFDLPETLETRDLLPALNWATSYVAQSNLMGEFRDKTLADAIMFRAWKVFEEPALTGPFLAHMVARLHQHGELCRGTNMQANKAFTEGLRTDIHRRRQFILELCRQPMDRLSALPYIRSGFVRHEDLSWLLEISPGGPSLVQGLSEQSLCSFVSFLFDANNNDQFEVLYSVCQRWPLLHAYFAFLINGTLIDSQEAVRARELQRQMQELRDPVHPPAVADLPAEISGLLSRSENGEWQAWWQLNLALMLTPESWGVGDELNYFITSMPGWASGDEMLRQRIIATAERYLDEADSSAELWLGKNPTPIYRNDFAAMRAFILLRQVASDAYGRIPEAIWAKWAPVIVGSRLRVIDGSSDEILEIVRDALAKAPEAFIGTVRTMLHMEKAQRRARADSPTQPTLPPFHFLHDLKSCWDSEELKHALFEEMKSSDIQPTEYAALLDALAEAGYGPAIEDGIARLTVHNDNPTSIADVLLRRAPGLAWPKLWPKLLADDELARAVLIHAAGSFYFGTPFYAGIDEDAIADLYLLMARLFPPEDDRPPPSGFVSPLDSVPSLRDGAPRYLAAMGTEAAVRALRRLVAERPGTPLLPFELSRGELSMRLKTWSPLDTKEIFALTDRPNARLVTSAADLMEILVATLGKFAAELHGAQTPVRDLWDRQRSTRLYCPIDENGLSDVIARYLRQELGAIGIFANREVEVTRRPGNPVGQRTDILVNTVRRGRGGESLDPIAAVIEVKGCWNPEVFTGLDEQLVRDYMVDLSAPVGIFLVGWFDKTDWDPSDSRRRQTPQRPISDVQNQLDQQAAAAPEGFQVRAMVMDIRSPGT